MNNKIALLIDCDNISFKSINSILKELEQYGDVIIKRAYGNWRSERLKNWAEKLTELSIKPIHQIDYTKGKNASDMAIVIDAMDLLHLKKADAFALVTSDSDFTPLTMKMLEEDFKVYCFGSSQTPPSLKNACSVFTNIQSLDYQKEDEKSPSKPKVDKNSIKNKSLEIYNKILSPDHPEVTMEQFNRELKDNGINFKDLGFKQFKIFVDSLNVFQITINEKNQGFVKLKQNFEVQEKNKEKLTKEKILATPGIKDSLLETYHLIFQKQKEVNMSTFFNYLSLQHKFNHKTFGYSSFKDFLNEIDLFLLEMKNEQSYLILKPL
jgi:uncharacterized protein (TIGR00288 family)